MAYRTLKSVPEGGTGNITLAADGVLYGNGTSAIGVTNVNRAGAYLASQGSGVPPLFTNGNSFVLINSTAVSGSPHTIAFTSLISATYNIYFFLYTNLAGSAADTPAMRFSTNNGSSYIATGYTTSLNWNSYNSTTITNTTFADRFAIGVSPNQSTEGSNGYCWIHNTKNGADVAAYGQAYDQDGGGFQRRATFSTFLAATSVNAFELLWGGGGTTFATGTLSLFGLLE